MSVRFTAEWLSPDGWVPLAGAATSPWQPAGSAEYTWGQAGWTYDITRPAGPQLPAAGGGRAPVERRASDTRVDVGTCAVRRLQPSSPRPSS